MLQRTFFETWDVTRLDFSALNTLDVRCLLFALCCCVFGIAAPSASILWLLFLSLDHQFVQPSDWSSGVLNTDAPVALRVFPLPLSAGLSYPGIWTDISHRDAASPAWKKIFINPSSRL